MTAVITWLEAIADSVPLPLLEVWGRFSYIIGLFLAICAFGGFTFRIGERWGFGRARQTWDTGAFLTLPLTFVLIIAAGYLGSFIVLVPGAQTFESLKDLVVLLAIVLLGYPALIAVPPAYMVSDLIEGVPPGFVLGWAEGYFFWTAFVWMAYQLIGRDPDFRRLRTWGRYGVFVVLIMAFDPVMWGFICSGQFTSAISYRHISTALFFTLLVTWTLAPAAFLVALPLARRFGWFWADVPGRVRERAIGTRDWTWEAGLGMRREGAGVAREGLPVRVFLFMPFVVLVLLMVGLTATVALRSAAADATRLATRLHEQVSANIQMRLNDHLDRSSSPVGATDGEALAALLRTQTVGAHGRAFILDDAGAIVASSAPVGDGVVASAAAALAEHIGAAGMAAGSAELRFSHVTARPLSREAWLSYATTYRDAGGGRLWTLVTAMPEASYLAGLRVGNSRAAMVFAVALVLSLVLAAALASMVTAPLRRMARVTQAMARGDLGARVPGSRLEELGGLAQSFNDMAARLETSFDDLVGEVEVRTRRERELKDSEARLRMSERRLQLAIDAAGFGIWDWDVEQDRLVWDDSMYRLYGVTRGEFNGDFDAWSRCLVPEDVAHATRDVEAALRGDREFGSDFRIRRTDGLVRVIRAVGQTIRDAAGRPVRMVGINRDVTELVDAEREHARLVHDLGERVKELRLLHAASRLLQRDRPFNRALLEQLVVLMPLAWQHPECCEARVVYGDLEVVTPGWRDSPWRQSTTFTTSEGSGLLEVVYLDERPAAAEGPFLAEERALLSSLSEMLVAYLELRKHHEQLEALVASRTTELRAAKEAAESASRAKSTFLATMSHEIRTPLNVILGYAQLLARDPELGGDQRQKVDIIHISGGHLLTLINDILEMSKIEAGRTTLLDEPFDLHALLDDVHRMFRELTGHKGLELGFELDADLPRGLSADAGKVRQVVINLLSNAVKFTTRGRIAVRAAAGRASEGRDVVVITVEDSGPGIEPQDLVRIFDAFDQADSRARGGGTGLGLAISRSFARLMHGDVVVASTPGQGSVFTFWFEAIPVPIEVVPGRVVPRIPSGLAPGQPAWKVLVVDDVPTNRHLLDELLVRLGFSTRMAASAEEAVVVHDEWRPDLLLMDVRMPGMSGLDATRLLRSRGSTAAIVAVTASGLSDTEHEARDAGVDAFVRKPYLEGELLAEIAARLGARYVYPPVGGAPASGAAAGPSTLAERLNGLPQALLDELREAAIDGRARRIEALADEVALRSEAASAEIRALARDFQYDVLVEALSSRAPDEV